MTTLNAEYIHPRPARSRGIKKAPRPTPNDRRAMREADALIARLAPELRRQAHWVLDGLTDWGAVAHLRRMARDEPFRFRSLAAQYLTDPGGPCRGDGEAEALAHAYNARMDAQEGLCEGLSDGISDDISDPLAPARGIVRAVLLVAAVVAVAALLWFAPGGSRW